MAIYREIQDYVKDKHGLTIKTCWIADMKELCGIPKKVSHNRTSIDSKVQPCPDNKKEFILDAFKHFKMID